MGTPLRLRPILASLASTCTSTSKLFPPHTVHSPGKGKTTIPPLSDQEAAVEKACTFNESKSPLPPMLQSPHPLKTSSTAPDHPHQPGQYVLTATSTKRRKRDRVYLALKKARKPINWIGKTAIIAVGAVIGTVAGVVCVPIVLAVKSILVALEALACLLSPVFIGVLGAVTFLCELIL